MATLLFAAAMVVAVMKTSESTIVLEPFPEALSSEHSPLSAALGGAEHESHAAGHGHKSPLQTAKDTKAFEMEFGPNTNLLNWESPISKNRFGKNVLDIPLHDRTIKHAKIVPIEGKLELELQPTSSHPSTPKIVIEDDVRVIPQLESLGKKGYDPMSIIEPRFRSKKPLWKTQMLPHLLPHPFHKEHGHDEHGDEDHGEGDGDKHKDHEHDDEDQH